MNVFQFNKVLYMGNVNKDFYIFCLKRNIKIIKYLFINLFYYIVSILFSSKQYLYIQKKYKYLRDVKNLNKVISEFYKNNKKISNYIDCKKDLIIDLIPSILIPKNLSSKTICLELDDKFESDVTIFNKKVSEIQRCNKLFVKKKRELLEISSNEVIVVNKTKFEIIKDRKPINKRIYLIFGIVFISVLLTCISFLFAMCPLNLRMYVSFFEPRLFLLNFIPILLLICLLYFMSKKLSVAYFVMSTLILILGVANQTKLTYRDDIVKFQDVLLFKEAMIMTERYDLVIKKYTIIAIILTIILTVFLKKIFSKSKFNIGKQLTYIFITLLLILFSYTSIYKNQKIYNSVGNTNIINIYISTRNYQVRGLIYPFIYTLEDGFDKVPDNYNEKEIEDILNSYEYENIPDDKKVNVIAIMLEAYNDFSKFKEIEFTEDIYKDFHQIQKKSLHGNLVTTIFGGGTIITERNFLTGYYNLFDFRKNTNSYVWYFKEQGYRTEAMHPIYGAFYNRASYNPNLGFDEYYNYENKFSKIQYDFMQDKDFFKYIIEGYEKSKNDKIPYFNFSVTYQNHGPYSSENYDGKEYYIKKASMSDEGYNTINQYFAGIKETNKALSELISYFENENEPVVVILFGDHNPYLGINALAYNELGINIDTATEDGFKNYYETPYIIYANPSAKKKFDNKFVGDSGDISPMFLMNKLFENCQFKGNQYLQYMNDLSSRIDVINDYFVKEDGIYVKRNLSKYNAELDTYKKVNYYYARNFKYYK